MNVALTCIAKNEDHYIEEWVRYHLKLGFDHVFIYENNWECQFDHPAVTKINWPGEVQQLNAYNHFIDTQKTNFNWAAIIDVDEFIVLHQHKTIKDFIHHHEDKPSIGLNWFFFGDNNQPSPNGYYGVLDRFTKRAATPDGCVKQIVNLTHAKSMPHPHYSSTSWYDTDGNQFTNTPFNPNGPTNQAQLNHYFTKTLDEFMLKRDRGRADLAQKRSISDFDTHNLNEVEDLTALNFYRS